ncbi:alpha/beta fold hydrolase [Pseudomonas turukhanskensis]|uniref:Epoxide hydrolase A n=1 Tax=Pseudomonas turukhanskensis TaxID=1806536 RepID=A0A9W6K7Q7_9PSED|nr:alpha/beta hydrolase [Pseudomonas turukhanskensis]GLK90442.1 epoxide hydrolase A [Pseudomonas turukhanskensis]
MTAFQQQLLDVNGITLSIYSAGPDSGRPVWLLHGFPECWYSWRSQMTALAEAGYRVYAPEMRGYGDSSAPEDVAAYQILTLCADIQGAMDALGHTDVCMIGHDWGAPVAWHLGLLEPERVSVLGAMSVPFGGRPKRPAIDIMREANVGRFNYIVYFQEPGVAEAELNADIERSMRLLIGGNSDVFLHPKPADAQFLAGLDVPTTYPEWCNEQDFAVYLRTLNKHGFHGPLNWYRNFEVNWQSTEFLAGRQVLQPTLFLLGEDDPVGKLEAYTVKKMGELVPRLESHVLSECGHWIQNERAGRVNELLLEFLGRHYPRAGIV